MNRFTFTFNQGFIFYSIASRPTTGNSLSTATAAPRPTSANRPTTSEATSRPARENASATTVRLFNKLYTLYSSNILPFPISSTIFSRN